MIPKATPVNIAMLGWILSGVGCLTTAVCAYSQDRALQDRANALILFGLALVATAIFRAFKQGKTKRE